MGATGILEDRLLEPLFFTVKLEFRRSDGVHVFEWGLLDRGVDKKVGEVKRLVVKWGHARSAGAIRRSIGINIEVVGEEGSQIETQPVISVLVRRRNYPVDEFGRWCGAVGDDLVIEDGSSNERRVPIEVRRKLFRR